VNYFQPTYHSKLYRDFKSIDATLYRDIVHFFERREEEIRQLDFEEFFEVLYIYVNALFEVGAYQKHLLMVDEVIEAAICHNLTVYKQEDIYKTALFRKAASMYNTSDFAGAEHILRELVRMDPDDQDAVLFLKKCLRNRYIGVLQVFRAMSILSFLLSALVICIELLVVRPFYPLHTSWVSTMRIAIFGGGIFSWVMGEWWHRWRAHHRARHFAEEHRMRKKKEVSPETEEAY
jgi:hypothetical protein